MSEHGWNDPPQLSYQSLSSSKKPATSLTKRVPHSTAQQPPVAATGGGQEKKPDSKFPPPPAHVIPIPPPQTKGTSTSAEVATDGLPKTDDEEAPQSYQPNEIIEYLESMLDKLQGSFQKRVYEDIKKRLQLASKQYNDGNVSPAVHKQMSLLVIALACQDFNEAERIHVGLMVDHVSQVNQWMVGVKKLVAIARQQETKDDK